MAVYIGTMTNKRYYTIEKAISSSSSYVGNNVDIYKSGYKIKNILIECSGKSTNTSQPTGLIVTASDGAQNSMQIYCGAGSSLSSKFEYQYSGSWTTVSSSLGTMYSGSSNTLSMNITSEGVVTTIVNGTTNTFTLTGNGKSALNNILNGASILSSITTRYYGEIGPAKVTVTYEDL